MASDTVPAAVPGPHDPPPGTAPTTPAGGPQQGGIAGLLAPVGPARAAFTLDPAAAADGTPDQAAAGITSDTYQLEEAAPEKNPGTTRTGNGGTLKEGVVKAWLRAGAERWRKGGDARLKRLDIQKAKAQARQVKETVTVNRSEKMVGGSTNSSTGSKNNAAGKSLNSKSTGAGNSGTGPKNRPGNTNNSGAGRPGGGGGRSGSDGRSGSGGQAGGGSRGSNTGPKASSNTDRTGPGHGKDSTGGRSGAKDSGSAKPSGGKSGDGSGAGPKNGPKPTGPKPTGSGTKTRGNSGSGGGGAGKSGAQGPAGKPGKDAAGSKTPHAAKDLSKSAKPGPTPGAGTNTPTGTEKRPKGPDAKDTGAKGGAGKVRLDKSGRTNGTTADGAGRTGAGTPGKDPKRKQDGGAQPTAKDAKSLWKPKGGVSPTAKDGKGPRTPRHAGTGTQTTAKTGTGIRPGPQTGTQDRPRVPAPRINLQNSREAGYRDGTRAAKTVAHIHAWRDGARDGYADTTQAAAREKTRLDKAHAARKNARTQPAKDTPVTPPATSADYQQTVPPKPDHAPGPQPIPVTGTDAGHVHLGDGAARPRLSRGEVRTLRGFQQRLETKTDTMTRAGEATRTLEQHALEQAKQVTDLLEQARSAEGGEKVVAALTQLADTARVQAGKAAETHQRAVRAGEACTVLHANTETRYGGIYQAVQDSPESRAARMTYYREMGTAHV